MDRNVSSFIRNPWAAILAAGLGVAVVAACGGGGGGSTPPPPPPPVVAVTVQPTVAVGILKIGEQATYTAVVTGTSSTAVNWSVSGAGCTGAACGTITTAGVYTAPAIVPQPPAVSIIATSQADTTKSGSYAQTIGSDVALAVWPQTARVTLNNNRQFLRMLTGSSNAAVTWSVSGMGCNVANCGSVTNGNYVAPPVIPPNTTTVFVVATSVVDAGKSAQAAVTLLASPNGVLNGTYAFGNRGISLGSEGAAAAMFVADGNGTLLSGAVDRSLPVAAGGKLVNVPLAGNYAIGNDHQGTLTLAFLGGSNDWRMGLNANGDKGFIQAYFNPEVLSSTVLYKTDPTQFTNAGVNGTYVFLLDGATVAGTRIANIGRFTANGNGSITNGAIETNEGGAISSTIFSGSYSVSGNGRASVTLNIGGSSYSFAMYVVNADMVILTSNDDTTAGVPARVGYAFRQTGGPFSVASLSGDYVFDLAGRNSAMSAIATVGRLTANGGGSASGQLDRNDNYTITLGGNLSATYTVDGNGRGTLGSPQLGQLVFYFATPNKAVLMEAPGARVQTGTFERQQAAPYATANLIGQFSQGTAPPAALNSLTVTARVFYDGVGIENSSQYVNALPPCGQSFGSTTAPYSVSSTGRIYIPDSSGNPLAAAYLINPGRYVLILQRQSGSSCDEVVQVNYAEQ
ncbi:MAG: hypothetical protein U5L03_05030 [Burkholderiaceae bacterium]|nr:hypothetical protein [Burkholderiaceae bacterium]